MTLWTTPVTQSDTLIHHVWCSLCCAEQNYGIANLRLILDKIRASGFISVTRTHADKIWWEKRVEKKIDGKLSPSKLMFWSCCLISSRLVSSRPAPSHLILSCSITFMSSCLISFLILSHLISSCPVLLHQILSYLIEFVTSCLVLSHLIPYCLVLSHFISSHLNYIILLSCKMLFCFGPSHHVLSCIIWSRLILLVSSCLILSYLLLSPPNSSRLL